MGIIKQAHDQFDADRAAFKLANAPTRAQLRKYVAAMVDAGNEWLNKFDAQDASAPTDFAATKASQFATFTAALPDPVLNPVDPNA
jgi:hypothetical protein